MDFNLINLLWSVLAIPITWFGTSYTKRGKRISDLENEVSQLKEKIEPLNNDLKNVTQILNDTRVSMEQRLYSIAIDQLKSKE